MIYDVDDTECSEWRYLRCLLPNILEHHLYSDGYRYLEDILRGQQFSLTSRCRFVRVINLRFKLIR